ncbi:hypothetical protein C2E23DRAFT_802800 [Lenzites betulinus]|nr:hypothetical protein C2E23DRAFT_802800 [Lenzites betulinus]
MNPHFKQSREGPPPPLPLPPHRPFPEGPFVVPPIPLEGFRGNLSTQQLEELDKMKLSESILALVPHGAGKAIISNATEVVTDIEGFLNSLAFEENDRLPYRTVVHPPDVRNRARTWNSNPFGKPWPFFLQLPRNAGPLRTFLLWQRVFAVSKTVSFTVYDLDSDVYCWDFYPIVGTSIKPNASHAEVIDQKELILTAIKRDMHADPDYRSFAAKMAFNNLMHSGGLESALNTLADTFHLERTEALDGEGNLIPAYIFMARPPTGSREEYQEWCRYFLRDGKHNRDAFRIALQRFDIAFLPTRVWCDLCKSQIHCTARCPWPAVKGWLGITPKDLGVRMTATTPPTYTGAAGVVISPLILAFRRAVNEFPAPTAARGRITTYTGRTGRGRGAARGRGTQATARGGRGGFGN